MPYQCRLIVNDPEIQLDALFTPETYHHIGILAANYWRYHLRYTGSYQLNEKKVPLDVIDIAEYLKFF